MLEAAFLGLNTFSKTLTTNTYWLAQDWSSRSWLSKQEAVDGVRHQSYLEITLVSILHPFAHLHVSLV